MKRTTLLSVLLVMSLVCSLFACLTLGASAEGTGPVALYLFDDEDNIGKDSSGNGNDLVVYPTENGAGVLWEDGKAVFVGEGAIATEENADFTDSLTEVTYAIKFKLSSDNKSTRTILSTGWSYHPAGLAIVANGDRMVNGTYACIKRTDGDLDMTTSFMFDEWHTIVLTISVNDNKTVAYFDGAVASSGTAAGYVSNHSEAPFTIGGFVRNLECMTGEVEEVAVFDRALTVDEVVALDMASLKPAENSKDPAPETGSDLVAVAILSVVTCGAVLTLKRRK